MKKMLRLVVCICSLSFLTSYPDFPKSASAAYSLTNIGAQQQISFSGFTAPIAWGDHPVTAGRLDSDVWAFQPSWGPSAAALFVIGDNYGIDDGFGSGRGTSSGGVTLGGVYAFDVGGGVTAFGVQPTAAIFTPGTITLKIINNTGVAMTQLDVAWDVYVRNDGGLQNSFDFFYSATNTDGSYQSPGGATGVLSPTTADPSATWVKNGRSYSISGLNIANGGYFYLRWAGNDVGGLTSTRDEFGLAGILLTAFGATSSPPDFASAPEAGAFAIFAGLLGVYALAFTVRRRCLVKSAGVAS